MDRVESNTKKLRIGGSLIPGDDGIRSVLNPYDGSVVGEVEYATITQMDVAVEAAQAAFEVTRYHPSHHRAKILRACSALLLSRKEELAQLITSESGKPIDYARVEVDRASFTFATAAECALHAREGRVLDMTVAPNGEGRSGSYQYFPLGVIAAITPFNFPLNLVAHKLAPAIAGGNTVVLKPAPQTPLTAFALAEILQEAGLLAGALNVVPCENAVAETLVQHPKVKMVSFTGSATVGWKLKGIAGKARVTLELGGNGMAIVDEIEDWEAFIKTVITSAFNYAGQVCIGLQTLLIRRELFAEVVSRVQLAVESISSGDPREKSVLVGPMISEAAAKKVEGWIDQAIVSGAKRLSGSYRAPNWMTPTLLTDVQQNSTIWQEEAFAPILILEAYDQFEEALETVNRSRYGLHTALFSLKQSKITKAYEKLEVGALIINDSNSYRLDAMPYGGVKNSGLGREGVLYAMREMSEMKLLVSR